MPADAQPIVSTHSSFIFMGETTRMLKSFRTTLMLVMIGLLIITFLTVVYFSRKETEKAMLFSANEGSQNALRLSLLTIENGYNDLLHFKKMRLDAHK